MKKNWVLGLLAVAALLVPSAITPTTYAASEKASTSVVAPEAACQKYVSQNVYYANGTPDYWYYYQDANYSGDLPLVNWNPTTYIATYEGVVYHNVLTCDIE